MHCFLCLSDAMSVSLLSSFIHPGTDTTNFTNVCQAINIQSGDQNTSETPDKGERITVENAHKFLEWLDGYGVLICVTHGYAIRNLSFHLQEYHTGNAAERRAVLELFGRHKIREAKDVPLPPALGVPFGSLGKPVSAFICDRPECKHISINRKGIRLHCNQVHNWKSSAKQREHWHSVWVQTFFKSAGLQKYFTVSHTEEEDVDRQADSAETTIQTTSAIKGGTRGVIENADVEAIVTD